MKTTTSKTDDYRDDEIDEGVDMTLPVAIMSLAAIAGMLLIGAMGGLIVCALF